MRLIARYAKDKGSSFEVITLYDTDIQREEITKENPVISTITNIYPSAIWFERKMQDDFGIIVEDAFDKRPLVHQERFPQGIHPMCKDFTQKSIEFSEDRGYEYEAIKGDGVFQVAVGPIHAGIIEPGHFQFSQAAEEMLHLEVRHFYKYRAIEKMLEGKTLFEAKPIIEKISGNESVAYQIALRDIMLQATKQELPISFKKYHAFLLELERIIHHLTDLGFIPNDAGFGAALAFCSKLSEDARRIMKEVTGHRFGFGAVDFESFSYDKEKLNRWLNELNKDMNEYESWVMDIPSLLDRLETTGFLGTQDAVKFNTVGVAARASGVAVDRRDNPFYLENKFALVTQDSGDVMARFKVRIDEVKNSILMMHSFLDNSNEAFEIGDIEDGEYMSYSESSIGELFMAIDIKDGVIERFFVRDPSFINWQTLHLMMRGDIIADFPLINKSCDLSYAGNDL